MTDQGLERLNTDMARTFGDGIRPIGEQRRTENMLFRRGIQILRLKEYAAIQASDEARAQGLREAIDMLVESWNLRS